VPPAGTGCAVSDSLRQEISPAIIKIDKEIRDITG